MHRRFLTQVWDILCTLVTMTLTNECWLVCSPVCKQSRRLEATNLCSTLVRTSLHLDIIGIHNDSKHQP